MMQELDIQEQSSVNGGWDLGMAVGTAAAVACLGPEAMVVGFIVGGFLE